MGCGSFEKAWPEWASASQLTAGRAQALSGDAWAQRRMERPAPPGCSAPLPCFLLSLSHLPRKDKPTRWRGTELQLETPGPQELSQPGIQGPRPPACPRLPAPRRAAPHPFPLSGPRTERAVCAGLAPLPPASQSKHEPKPQAQPAPLPQPDPAVGGMGLCLDPC